MHIFWKDNLILIGVDVWTEINDRISTSNFALKDWHYLNLKIKVLNDRVYVSMK